jgi:hypothetical protein
LIHGKDVAMPRGGSTALEMDLPAEKITTTNNVGQSTHRYDLQNFVAYYDVVRYILISRRHANRPIQTRIVLPVIVDETDG